MKTKILTIFLLCFVFLCNAQVYLYTPNGSRIFAFQHSEWSDSADIAYFTAECALEYPDAEILADASLTYNCHSYAWNMSEGGPICWLEESPDLHLYWDDGSYDQTTEDKTEKIFYYNGDYGNHSAVKSTTHPGKYESKLGSYPLVRHDPGYGPSIYNMQYRRYYRRCRTTNLTNQTVTINTTVTDCIINAQNVTVTNNAKLTLDAFKETIVNGPFEIQLGSELEIK
jgi:hypothetical protein